MGNEPEQILLGMRWNWCASRCTRRPRSCGVGAELGKAACELRIHRRRGFRNHIRIAFASYALIDIDVLLEGERRIEYRFHAIKTVFLDRHTDLACVRCGLLDDVFADLVLTALEQKIVAGEVGVSQHVSGHQNVFGVRVRLREIGAPGVTRKDDFEQSRQSHPMLNELVDVAHAEGPVRHAHRQSVDGDLRHEAFGYDLELDSVVSQPLAACELFDAGDVCLPVFGHEEVQEGARY